MATRYTVKKHPLQSNFSPLLIRGGRYEEVFNESILVTGSAVETGRHGRCREVAVSGVSTLQLALDLDAHNSKTK